MKKQHSNKPNASDNRYDYMQKFRGTISHTFCDNISLTSVALYFVNDGEVMAYKHEQPGQLGNKLKHQLRLFYF